jgi:hypothetical protein
MWLFIELAVHCLERQAPGVAGACRSPSTYRDRRPQQNRLCELCAVLCALCVEKCGGATKSGVAGEPPNRKRRWRHTHRDSTQSAQSTAQRAQSKDSDDLRSRRLDRRALLIKARATE